MMKIVKALSLQVAALVHAKQATYCVSKTDSTSIKMGDMTVYKDSESTHNCSVFELMCLLKDKTGVFTLTS